MSKSLIANSGIQFITEEFFLNELNISKINCKLIARSVEENGRRYVEPIIAEYDSELDSYVDYNGNPVDEDSLSIIRASEALSLYQGRWIPLPYFIEEQYSSDSKYIGGPIGWCRGMVQKTEKSSDSYILTLAFDTYLDVENRYNQEKFRALNENTVSAGSARASLADDLRDNDTLLSERWINEYLSNILKDGQEVAGISKAKVEGNQLYYFGLYLSFLKLLKKFAPTVSIYDYNTEVGQRIDVDFVLDIGNSRSCGVLIESTQQDFHKFDFTNATTFHLRDLHKPHITYSDPFEMKVEFIKANFGNFEDKHWNRAFYWPSVVRVGKEAIDRVFAVGKLDVPTGMSSPKRYLWDGSRRKIPWYFNPEDITQEPKTVDTGRTILSEMNIDYDGKLSKAVNMEIQAKYSRRAMMTFTLIEIFLQAGLYINSFDFRQKRGNQKRLRVLKRIVLTTPTAMLNTDKKTFRECADSAIEILREFYSQSGESIFDYVEIIPSADDVITNPEQASQIVQRKEWGFDEATCVQLAFMYGEIWSKYQNNHSIFFDIEGRNREILTDAGTTISGKSVTVASLDIGGGTTDLMICSYINESKGNVTVVSPYPEFYEGFNIAGDDILKRVIERLVLRKIEMYAKEKGCKDTRECINFLFGNYSSLHSASDKEYKKYLTDQFLIPVSIYALEIATKDDEVIITKSFNQIIDELRGIDRIKDDILDYVNNYFEKFGAENFKLDEIEFVFSTQEINQIITQVMAPVINKLSMIVAQLKCDYLIIAGQPSKLKIIKELVNRYLPITPDRVIPLGDYHIGKWYPFAKGSGLISDPKTTVAVGATVALMGGTMMKLNGFRINTDYLKKKVKSTARYIGGYDTKNKTINDIIFSPGNDSSQLTFNGPTYLGMKQLNVKNWPGACMYKVDFANDEVAKALSRRLPIKMSIDRKPQNPEIIVKSSLEDRDGNPIKGSHIVLIPQTLGDEDGYWLDTGIFHTAIF
jgi:hypothetical protein